MASLLPFDDLLIMNATAKTLLTVKTLVNKYGDKEDMNKFVIFESGVNLSVKLYKEIVNGSSFWKMGFEGIRAIVPAIPVIAKTFKGKHQSKEETESLAVATLESLNRVHDDQYKLEDAFTKWDRSRKRLIKDLRNIVEEMKIRKKRSGIAKLTGASTSIVGLGVGIGATVLSIVTAGFATPILAATIGGVAMGVAGGAVAGGASITDEVLKSKSAKKANELIKDNTTLDELKTRQKQYQASLQVHIKTAQNFDKCMVVFEKVKDVFKVAIKVGNKIKKYIGVVKDVYEVAVLIAGKSINFLNILTLSGSIITKGLTATTVNAGKMIFRICDGIGEAAVKAVGITALRAAGIAVSVLAIGLDLYTIVKTSIDIHKDNLDKAAIEIERIAKELEEMTAEDLILQSVCSSEVEHEIDK